MMATPASSKEVRSYLELLHNLLTDFRFKERFGKSIVCGFGKIHGLPIGIIANNGILFRSDYILYTLCFRFTSTDTRLSIIDSFPLPACFTLFEIYLQ